MEFISLHITQKTAESTTRILMFAILVLATIDTRMFVYPSLSRTLLSEIIILTLAVSCIFYCITKKKHFIITKFVWFIFIWVAYITIHYTYSFPHEQYRTIYLSVTLLTIPTVAFYLRQRVISRTQCEDMLLAVAIIHLIYIIAQWLRLIDSGNKYFPLTGSYENPTVTALYFVGCVPIIVARIKNTPKNIYYTILLTACIIAIVVLHCRTAYMGLGIEIIIGTISCLRTKNKSLRFSYRFIVAFLVLLMVTVAIIKLYNMKRDSADGRLLIWKLSTEMIIEKPAGHGYGTFEKYYNLRQAEHFAQGNGTETEKRNASFAPVPYNDYLEHSVEGGIIGVSFLIAFYYLLVRKSIQNKDTTSFTTISAFAFMSLTNFVYTSILPWLLLMFYCAFVIADTKSSDNEKSNVSPPVPIILITLFITGIFKIFMITKSQLTLLYYKEKVVNGEYVHRSGLLSLQNHIGTSEAYWNLLAYNDILSRRYTEAIADITEALNYTSAPQTLEMAFYTYMQLGQEREGIKFIHTINNMQPVLLRPKLLLMQYYDKLGDSSKALHYAKEIEFLPHKIDSKESESIRNKAHDYIESHK